LNCRLRGKPDLPKVSMRILVLSDKVFTRTMGDGLRVHGLLRPLLERHSFDLIAFARPGESLEDDIRSLFKDATLVPLPEQKQTTLLRRFVSSVTVRDFKPTSGAMQTAIQERIQGENYDLVLDIAANALPSLPRTPLPLPLVVDSIDEPLLREARAIRSGPWRDRASHLYRAWQFWLYERRMLHRAALNLYVSEVDAAAYRRYFPMRRVAVVPNGVDIEYFAPSSITSDPGLIVFEGNMNFPPNVDAARRLVTEILPQSEYAFLRPRFAWSVAILLSK
jgi:polysaccharide biosynthesis protein PslH